jgi:hypothetical protein
VQRWPGLQLRFRARSGRAAYCCGLVLVAEMDHGVGGELHVAVTGGRRWK